MSHNMKAIVAQLRQAGYRVTPQRQMILDAVCELGGHVTPEEVYVHINAINSSLNQATVYRTLHFLSDRGVITVTQLTNGRFGYEIAGAEPHHHLVCRQCHNSVEMPHQIVRQLFNAVEGKYDFAIEMDHISFFGLCTDCRDN